MEGGGGAGRCGRSHGGGKLCKRSKQFEQIADVGRVWLNNENNPGE